MNMLTESFLITLYTIVDDWMRRHLVVQMSIAHSPCQLIDGTPVQVRHWRRFGKGYLL